MLKWLFRKQIARAEAIEVYLSHFDEIELAYLKNHQIMALNPAFQMPMGLTLDDRILLVSYIQAELMACRGEIQRTPIERGSARAKYNLSLGREISRTKGQPQAVFFQAIVRHRADHPDLNSEQRERLDLHSTVLERIFLNPKAPSLPELEEIGEGSAWRV